MKTIKSIKNRKKTYEQKLSAIKNEYIDKFTEKKYTTFNQPEDLNMTFEGDFLKNDNDYISNITGKNFNYTFLNYTIEETGEERGEETTKKNIIFSDEKN